MKLYYAGFCVSLLLMILMLSSCSEFEAKIEEMNIINQNDGLQE